MSVEFYLKLFREVARKLSFYLFCDDLVDLVEDPSFDWCDGHGVSNIYIRSWNLRGIPRVRRCSITSCSRAF